MHFYSQTQKRFSFTLFTYFWALLRKISVGQIKNWRFFLEIYLVSVIIILLVMVWWLSNHNLTSFQSVIWCLIIS